ncbi:eukaryotic translation initiation factor 5B [Scheffersomyces spartinae]|uniref:Eukaryotic translation initiation factor 5B n=1 Tax=Scheffersomyces spartinae TaxID=45513 RepID=A0A9P8AIL1_9ASCO|nr:eukaryotic translation initiation factor 5B [Scheffersomyces spartinae]KAG7193846.1 eukaryotic translation initiation factor 5B [Scheffersomyces spartinae]
MAKKGKKDGKSGGDFWDEEEYVTPEAETLGELPVEASTGDEPSVEVEGETSEEGLASASADFLSSIRQSKKNKEAKEEAKKTDDGPKLLSKKEKEKLKKEAEKQKKKEAAAKKKQQQADKKEQIKEANKANAEAAKSSTPEPEGDESKPKPAAKKGGKKVPAGLAALKRQMELKKQLEEEQRRLEEEEQKRIEEEEKAAAEEEAEKEAARAAKKEKDRLKKEQLKAEGKYMTKKQKDQKKLQEARRQALLSASGITVAAFQKDASETVDKPKRVIYGKKKSSKPKTVVQNSQVKEEKKVEETKTEDDEEETLLNNWETALDDEEPVVESWEAALDEDEGEEDAKAEDQEEDSKAAEEEAQRKAAEEAQRKAAEEEAQRKAAAEEEAKRKAEEERKKDLASKSVAKSATPAPQEKEMRSPICVILGHVDTGKTKLLDKIRQTNVQGGEAGGITQQIGATYFPIDALKLKTDVMSKFEKQTFDVPGLLVIDTPGHESFTNLRSRGSSLCNIAILVVDIMHGLEPQTIESIRLLRDRKAPFIVALNKIDRLYDWQTTPNNSFRDSFAKQSSSVQGEFKQRYEQIKLALSEQGLNSELYFQNKNMAKYVSIVPTSAVTGEGVPDLLWLLLELTQKRMSKQLMYLSKVEATILEVKVVEGFGYTIDVVLSNGVLKEGDRVVLCGLNGPIATNIRALLTPPPAKELRIKSEYVHHKQVKAALGVKIAANDLEKAVAGSRLVVVGEDDDEEEIMDDIMEDLTGLLDSVDSSGKGVVVQASTLGSLEALLDFLKDMKIPVMSIGLGPVYKRDIMKAAPMLEKAPEFAVMLCFDVKIDKEAEQYAEEQKIKIFNADIIYHLFDQFTAYQSQLMEKRRQDFLEYAIFPTVLKTIQIINKRNPMIIGVDVMEGTVKIGTPICAVRRDPATGAANIIVLGKVVSLEVNHKSSESVKKGQTNAGVAMRLENPSSAQPTWGRHVDESDLLYSLISRRSIDTLKDPAFRDSVSRDDWLLIKKMKPIFDIK